MRIGNYDITWGSQEPKRAKFKTKEYVRHRADIAAASKCITTTRETDYEWAEYYNNFER